MGNGAGIPQSDKFEEQLEELWANEENRAEMEKQLRIAQRFIGRKKREQSVGKVPYPLDESKLEELWAAVDYNGNNMTSLAELDKLIVEQYPEYDNKPAVMRAYQACDRNRNGFITKHEFRNFFGFLDYFTRLWEKFEAVSEGDRRISYEEMKAHSKEIFNKDLSEEAATILFNCIDRNGKGMILFHEFCAHMAWLDNKDFTVDKLPFE